MAKSAYRQKVIQACHIMNEKLLTAQAKGKCERLGHEKYGKKDYLQLKNMYNVRRQYRTRFGLEPFAGNYSKDKRFAKTSWLCLCKEEREEEIHILSGKCKVYGDLTHKFSDLTDDDQLVQFFSDVLARRDLLEHQTPGGGVITTVSANPDSCNQDKPIQRLYLSGSI